MIIYADGTNITATPLIWALWQSGQTQSSSHWRVKARENTLGICKTAPKGPSDSEKQDYLVWWTSNLAILLCSSPAEYITKEKCAGSILLLWACFSAAGTGRLARVEGKLNRAKYRDIINENPFNCAQDLRLGWRFTFQHDNDHKHTAKAS